MEHRTYPSEHVRRVVERALANRELMASLYESLASEARGEEPIPGKLVQEEARAPLDGKLQA